MSLAREKEAGECPFTTLAKVRASWISSRTAAATARLERMVVEDAMMVQLSATSAIVGIPGCRQSAGHRT